MERPKRKPNRLPEFDYSTPGAYFITICTEEKKNLLGCIVGGGAFDAPRIALSPLGNISQKYILSASKTNNVRVDKYVIMPNHIHLILFVNPVPFCKTENDRHPSNTVIPHFISTFKRFCYRDAGVKFFQRSYHDHIIRGEKDYLKIWQYIDNNPARWNEDCFYIE